MSDDYEMIVKNAEYIAERVLGKVITYVSGDSHGLRTTFRRHDNGFSVTHYRRTFTHNGRVEIPDTSEWHVVRHQEWRSNPIYAWLDAAYHDVPPSMPIKGDIDD